MYQYGKTGGILSTPSFIFEELPFRCMLRNRFLISILIFLLPFSAGAQSYYFKNYQVSNGLSSNTITSILQDKKGFMWFGTRNGLNRFDGTTFRIFRNDPEDSLSLGSNSILSLYEDEKEQLWIGTYKGIYIYDPVSERFTAFKKLAGGETRYISRDSSGSIWIINNFTLSQYDTRNGQLKTFSSDSTQTIALSISPQGELWIATSYGTIKKYNPATGDFLSYDLAALNGKKPLTFIQDIYPASDSTLLIGTMNQALLFNTKTNSLTNIFQGDPNAGSIQIHKIIRQSKHEYWLGTETGIYIVDLNNGYRQHIQKEYSNPFSITDNVIYSFCKDREGGTWIGSFFGGINYYSSQLNQFRKYFPNKSNNSISGNLVHEICEDQYGHIWIGTEDAGLNKLDPRTGRITQFMPGKAPGSISYQNIHGLVADGNRLWIGTYEHGLDVMDIPTGKVVRHYATNNSSLQGNFIVTLYKTSANEILIGAWNGLFRYNREKDNFTRDSFFNMQIQTIHEDADGTIWVGSYGNGVYYRDPHTGKSGNFRYDLNDPNSLPTNYVNNLYQDSRKNLWISTEAGLCKFDRSTGKITRFNKNGLSDKQVFRVLEDGKGLLWVSTSRGLLCLDPSNGTTKTYTTVNGLLSEQFNYNSGYKSTDGSFYFGTLKGMISFNPASLKKDEFIPPVYITGLQVNNHEMSANKAGSPLKESVMYAKEIVLPYDSSTLSFDIAALSYVTPEINEYAYIMEGLDKEWTSLKSNRKIFYTKLPPGSYSFRVKGSGSGEIWNEKEAVLKIRVLPPWWASPWAYILYTLAIAAILWTIFRYYHIALKEKNKRKIETLEIEKEREIYNAKIEFFTNIAHEIRTPLTLIRLPLDKLLKNETDNPSLAESLTMMKKNTNRLIDLTDQLLDFRKAEANKFSLNFIRTDITDLLKELFASFKPIAEQKKISLRLEVPRVPLHASVDPEAFRKILGNLFNNAIKYADTTVTVRLLPFNSDDNVFHIEIRNDGHLIPYELKEKIFEPFYRLKETARQAGTGIGLPLARSLAELHKGVLDLKRPENELNVFLLSIPIHQENEINLQEYETFEVSTVQEEAVSEQTDPGKMSLLIVEDNREILQFIQRELQNSFTIYKAHNGEEALQLLEKENIQLVISDIMMPVMDGIELCRRMKTDLQYSHIPIILLTAKNTLHSKIEGLEVGADAYIEKPFSLEHLQAQINNLLTNRNIIKEYFAKSPLTHIKGIASSKADKNFLEELHQIIQANITDMDLDVDKLSRMMNMSRTSFYRKIKGLSDLTPNELINISRLKKAAELLAEGEYKINEVASMVGYSLNSNFSRDFHKQFGVTPSNYLSSLPRKG